MEREKHFCDQCSNKEKELIELRQVNTDLHAKNVELIKEIQELKGESSCLVENVEKEEPQDQNPNSAQVIKHLRDELTKEKQKVDEMAIELRLAEEKFEEAEKQFDGLLSVHVKSTEEMWRELSDCEGTLEDVVRIYEKSSDAWSMELLNFMGDIASSDEEKKELAGLLEEFNQMKLAKETFLKEMLKDVSNKRKRSHGESSFSTEKKMKVDQPIVTGSTHHGDSLEDAEACKKDAAAANAQGKETDDLNLHVSIPIDVKSCSEKEDPLSAPKAKTVNLNIPKIAISSNTRNKYP